MVRHIVLFKLKSELSAEQKAQVINDFKKAIEALPATIDFIRSIEVSGNINPDEEWDICLNSTFDTLDDVKAYSVNPNHVAAAKILAPYKAGRSCVDYQF